MIPMKEKEGWHYLAAKKLSALLRGIYSKHNSDFCCLNCLHSFRTENKLKSHEKVCKNKDFCNIVMPSRKDNISEFVQYMNSYKTLYIIYADMESLIKKIDGCANNPEHFSTAKIGEHIPCEYSASTILKVNNIEHKHNLYHGEDCVKMFCSSLREDVKMYLILKRKKMLPLTKKT